MSTDNDPLSKWLESRVAFWRASGDRLTRIEKSKDNDAELVLDTIGSYKEIARDLSVARQAAPGGVLTRYLEQVYSRHYRAIFKRPGSLKRNIIRLLLEDVPEIAWQLRSQIASVTALFVLSGLAGWWLVSSYPELAALFASESMINGVERGELWTDDILNIVPSSVLAVQILSNNIVVSLFAMCLGVFYGLGTAYIIALNGTMLGGVFAMTAQHGVAGRLFEFVIAHGIVELSVICIAGAVGVSLGASIARPGNRTRAQAFHIASVRGAKLMLLCALFLVGAGIIEGYISPDHGIPMSTKVTVGVAYMLLFVATIAGVPHRLLKKEGRN